MKKAFVMVVAVVYALSLTGCASLYQDRARPGLPLYESQADPRQLRPEAESVRIGTWWERNWPYLVGGIIVGAIIIALLSASDDGDGTVPSCCGGGN